MTGRLSIEANEHVRLVCIHDFYWIDLVQLAYPGIDVVLENVAGIQQLTHILPVKDDLAAPVSVNIHDDVAETLLVVLESPIAPRGRRVRIDTFDHTCRAMLPVRDFLSLSQASRFRPSASARPDLAGTPILH